MKINIQGLVRAEVKNLEPYSVYQTDYKIKLDAMENPYDLPKEIKKQILRKLARISFNRYPDPTGASLREVIGKYIGVLPDKIILGNGSDELILQILLAFGGWGKRVVYPVPTFSIYGILTQVTGAYKKEISLETDFQLDAGKILRESPDIIFLAYPNNPTGNCFRQEEILELLDRAKGLVVIDEAYYEFSDKTFLPYLNKFDNLVILRTFSKAFGLAGLRIGYLIANQEIIKVLSKVKLPYNVNALSQQAAEVMVKNYGKIKPIIKEIKKERGRVYENLKNRLTCFESETNFILVETSQAHALNEYLLKKKILIKSFGEAYLKNYLRVTIGKQEENNQFLMAVKKFMEKTEQLQGEEI